MKMKKWVCFGVLVAGSVLLFGCGATNSDAENVSGVNATEVGSVTESKTEGNGLNAGITFPEYYENIVDHVNFGMDIIIQADLAEKEPVIARAQMKKVDEKEALRLFFSSIDQYDTYEYEGENEHGETVNKGTYVSPEETTLSYGPVSSQMTYMERDLMPFIRSAFTLDPADERYNADLYSTTDNLSFKTRDEAFQEIADALAEVNMEFEYDYTGYALRHGILQSQEYHTDIDGNIDVAQYKGQWSSADEGYYFCIGQKYRDLPLYHVYYEIFSDVVDANTPVQAFVSADGIEYLQIEKIFDVSEEKTGVQLLPIDAIAETVADKYNQILGDSTYEIAEAELCYYVDLSSGMGVYDVKPVWIVKGVEKAGQNEHYIQVIVDAQTAKEIIP